MHPGVFTDLEYVTEAFINAIERHHDRISSLGHPDINKFSIHLDMKKVIDCCNAHSLPMEFNCANLVNGKTDLEKCHIMLKHANEVYINSDAHTLHELTNARPAGVKWLVDNGYLEKNTL